MPCWAERGNAMSRALWLAGMLALALLQGCGSEPSQPPASSSVAAVAKATPPPAGIIHNYDSNIAMNLSGEFVPRHIEDYYFIEILADQSDSSYIDELSRLLQQAHANKDWLGIVAEDAERMRRLLLASLAVSAPGSLSDAIVIVIGRAQDEGALRDAVEASGARFHFGVYSSAEGFAL